LVAGSSLSKRWFLADIVEPCDPGTSDLYRENEPLMGSFTITRKRKNRELVENGNIARTTEHQFGSSAGKPRK
jgi:hypothetical protein